MNTGSRQDLRHKIYGVLENPLIYTLLQKILAPGSSLNKNMESFFLNSKGPVLDVGCGPQLTTMPTAGGIVGVDINWKYVWQYFQAQAIDDFPRTGIVAAAQKLPFKDNIFQESRCFGLLHHLPDEEAKCAIQEMLPCTKINGRAIIL